MSWEGWNLEPEPPQMFGGGGIVSKGGPLSPGEGSGHLGGEGTWFWGDVEGWGGEYWFYWEGWNLELEPLQMFGGGGPVLVPKGGFWPHGFGGVGSGVPIPW